MTTQCACGLNKNYLDCCGRFIDGNLFPSTPQELMRSRYTAYTQANMIYIKRTMKSLEDDAFDIDEERQWAQKTTWENLEVLNTSTQGEKGIVEFIAHYIHQEVPQTLHEISEFRRENGIWYYIGAKLIQTQPPHPTTIGRNQPCSCGSNKKYKKCCGK